MLYGNARITAVDQSGKSFVSDVGEGDLWLFPPGIPHSIQGLGPDGCRFLLVFDDGNFDEFHTFLITDWLAHTPKEVLAKNFNVPASTFDRVPKKELFIFQAALPGDLKAEQAQAAEGTGSVPKSFDFRASKMQPTKVTPGGHVKIIDSKIFPVTPITAAIVTLKPGGLRELHWHPNADEWQYYITGQGRMTLFIAGSDARTMDFQAGDVGYVPISNPHYIENTGDSDLVFSRNVQVQRISGHLVGGMDGAHAASTDGSAFASRQIDARVHPQAGDGHHAGLVFRFASTRAIHPASDASFSSCRHGGPIDLPRSPILCCRSAEVVRNNSAPRSQASRSFIS